MCCQWSIWTISVKRTFLQRIFHCNLNSTEILLQYNCIAWYHTDEIFCTCHDSTSVVPCATYIPNWIENTMKFPSTLKIDGKFDCKMGPRSASLTPKQSHNHPNISDAALNNLDEYISCLHYEFLRRKERKGSTHNSLRIFITSHEHVGNLNQRWLNCLYNSVFWLTSMKTSRGQ